jgi:alginate O-acetyltransferase complex protein AlgI
MPVAWIGALAYCFQIFFDFCGYSDMAIGMGSMFGFTILENFRFPYVSLSVREFWRRWHISLSTWFREYLYIPLGGNRKGRARECLNKCIVFLCTGLWHGASWTFVLWGLFHGFFLILETLHVIRAGKRIKALSWLYTMLVVAVGFVLFRADTLGQAVSMIGAMFTGFRMNARHLSLIGEMLSPTVLITTAAAVLASIPIVPALERRLTAPRAAVWLRSTGYAATIVLFFLCVLSLSSATYNPFIYFRF